MKIKVNGKDEDVEIKSGCGGCLFWAAVWFWVPIIIIILIWKFL